MQHPAQIESMPDSRLHTTTRRPDRAGPRAPSLSAAPLRTAHRWLSQIPFHSPLEQRQAALLHAFLLGSLLTGGLLLAGQRQTADRWVQTSVCAAALLALGALSLLVGRLRGNLRRLRERSLQQEQELEQTRRLLTAALSHQAAPPPPAGARLDESELAAPSTPLQPILPGVLLAPLIGGIDNQRMLGLIDQTFEEIERHHARHVIFDLSATPKLDPASAAMLLRFPAALRHLDAELTVVGLSAQVALTLCRTGADLGAVRSHRTLQEALQPLLVEYAQTWPVLNYRLSADLRARTENN